MEKIKLVIFYFVVIIILLGCGAEDKGKKTILVDVGVIYSDAGELVTAPMQQVLDNLNAWSVKHHDLTIIQRKRLYNSDFSHLAVLGSEHLPDVFITDCVTGQLLAQSGRVLKLSNHTDSQKLIKFKDGAYAFPVLREDVSVIIYDSRVWKKGDSVSYIANNSQSAVTDYLSSFLADDKEWFTHMIAGDKQASFTDMCFINKLGKLKSVIAKDTPRQTFAELSADFVSGKSTAIVLNGDNVYRLLEKVKECNSSIYDCISFSPFYENVLPRGYQYGVFLNVRLAEQPEKLRACMDLAASIAQEYKEKQDATLARLEKLKLQTNPVYLTRQKFTYPFWNNVRTNCISPFLTGKITAEECAAGMQNYYEQQYLGAVDFLKKKVK